MKKLLFVPAVCLLFTACNNNSGTNVTANDHQYGEEQCDLPDNTNSADWVTTGKVKEAILTDSKLSVLSRFISVSTTDGIVTLGGTVASEDEASEAIKVTKQVDGVKGVVSQIKIKPKA